MFLHFLVAIYVRYLWLKMALISILGKMGNRSLKKVTLENRRFSLQPTLCKMSSVISSGYFPNVFAFSSSSICEVSLVKMALISVLGKMGNRSLKKVTLENCQFSL